MQAERMILPEVNSAITTLEVTTSTWTLPPEPDGDDDDEGDGMFKLKDANGVEKSIPNKDCEDKAKMKITDAIVADATPTLTVVTVGKPINQERIVDCDFEKPVENPVVKRIRQWADRLLRVELVVWSRSAHSKSYE